MGIIGKNKKEDSTTSVGNSNILDVSASMQGALAFKDPVNLRISGNFEGKLETRGELTIGEKAVVKADIHGDIVNVSGTVTGNIIGNRIVSLSKTSKMTGDITTPLIKIDTGALFNGKVRMAGSYSGTDGDSSSGLKMSVDDVAQYLEVEKSLIKTWAEKGKIPASQVNDTWVFDKYQVDEWVETQK